MHTTYGIYQAQKIAVIHFLSLCGLIVVVLASWDCQGSDLLKIIETQEFKKYYERITEKVSNKLNRARCECTFGIRHIPGPRLCCNSFLKPRRLFGQAFSLVWDYGKSRHSWHEDTLDHERQNSIYFASEIQTPPRDRLALRVQPLKEVLSSLHASCA